jgi:hypothetical protein
LQEYGYGKSRSKMKAPRIVMSRRVSEIDG